ncbi:MAG TPA: manganese efflux pump MntP family protein [Clostridiales bacterium]|nr:manganese efflux pump MntP family protein [Clostridiales bacterium]
MGFAELMVLAVGLSMDAFAVAACRGLAMKKFDAKNALVTAFFFGGFQALMPLLGWLLGRQFEKYITGVDHWIAFALLGFIGGKMIFEFFKPESCPADGAEKINFKELTALAFATSIDALAAGITFAFLDISVSRAVTLIGITTFLLSFIAAAAARKFGGRLGRKAELAGGAALILIGLKILLGDLGFLPF